MTTATKNKPAEIPQEDDGKMTIITRAGQTIKIDPEDWHIWRLRSARKANQAEPEVKRGTNNP